MNTTGQNQGGTGQSSSAAEELSRNLSLALMAASNGSSSPGGNQLQSGNQVAQEQGAVSEEDAKDAVTPTAAPAAAAPQNSNAETTASSPSSSVVEADAMPSIATSISPVQEDSSVARKKPSKKDRSKLRKGKWTVEEEEYTTRIIHHFSTGLLTLPEGATLRSYLADKLNCDPMRITKKFAGASCLGRRVFHLRNRPQPSYEEIQMARAELDQLEQRFRLRVEHGYGGMPLTNRPEMMLQFSNSSATVPAPSGLVSQTSAPMQSAPSPNNNNALSTAHSTAATAFLQNFATVAAAAGANGNPAPSLQLPSAPAPSQSAASALSALAGVPGAAQWLLPNPPASTQSSTPAPSMDASVQAVNDAVTNWAWTQVAASLSNALPQFNAANAQQQQQQQLIASLSRILPQLAAANLQQQAQQPNPQQQQQQQVSQQHSLQQPSQQQLPQQSLQRQPQQLHSAQQPQQLQAAARQQFLQQENMRPAAAQTPPPAIQQQQSQSSLQPQQRQQQQQEGHSQHKPQDPQDLLKKAHADEANSFALQLRKAYEKQLKAREEAEKKKKAEAESREAKSTAKSSEAHSKSKPTERKLGGSQSPKSKPQKEAPSPKDAKTREPRASLGKKAKAFKTNKESKISKAKELPAPAHAMKPPTDDGTRDKNNEAPVKKSQSGSRTEEEKEAGTILMGFLSSLRDSYEDALRRKKPAMAGALGETPGNAKKRARQEANESTAKKQKLPEMTKPSKASTQEGKPQSTPLSAVIKDGAKKPAAVPNVGKTKASAPVSAASSLADSYRQFTSANLQSRRNPPNYITDMSTSTSETSSGNNSTNPVESSLEDSDSNSDKCGDMNSDKGKDNPSSSEEDNKLNSGRRDAHFRSKGPPRKRIKSKKMSDEMLMNAQSASEEKATD